MSKQGKIFSVLSGVFFLTVVLWAVLSVPEPPEEEVAHADRIMHYDSNTIHAEKDGKMIWRLETKDMEMDIDTSDAAFGAVEGVLYGADGKELRLTAPAGTYNAKTYALQLSGGVVIESNDGLRLTSERLEWSELDAVVSAIGDAKLVDASRDLAAIGERIESSDAFTKFAVKGDGEKKAEIRKGSAGN